MDDSGRALTSGGFSALSAGTVLDRYRIDSVIAAGGFGITYLCHHTTLGRPYALKEHFPRQFAYRDATTMDVHPIDPAIFSWALDRFLQEGRALASCHHPNVVSVADVFEANQTAYMVLGYEEGRSLKDWLEMLGRPPTQDQIDAILIPMLDALAYVHGQGLLHRDIAPDNIMIRSDGKPCLIDFGSARRAVAERSQVMSSLVKSGYSPPEQYTQSSRSQGPWSDIYAFGATLYRAVTGHTPPESTDRAFDDALIPLRQAIANPHAYRASLLDGIEKSLVFHYAKRPQSIADWRAILFAEPTVVLGRPGASDSPPAVPPASTSATEAVGPSTTQGTPDKPPSRSRRGMALAAVAALMLLLGSAVAIDLSLRQSASESAATLKIEEDRIAHEKEAQQKAAAAAAQTKTDHDARIAREKAERDNAETERAAALKRKIQEDARIAGEKEAQRRAAEERAERERAERQRAQEAAADAARKRAEDDARIARERAERERAAADRAAALKLKLEEDARVAREIETQRKTAEERSRSETAEKERADEQAARQKAEDDARIARETAEREKADADRAAAFKLKVEEDARLAREQEAQRKTVEERAKREQAEKKRSQKAAADAAAARDKATINAKKGRKAEQATKQAGTNCPESALSASKVLWNSGEIRSGGVVTGRHPCGRSMQCSGGFGGAGGGFGRSCRWL
jgi:serine/threonine protein kinase